MNEPVFGCIVNFIVMYICSCIESKLCVQEDTDLNVMQHRENLGSLGEVGLCMQREL